MNYLNSIRKGIWKQLLLASVIFSPWAADAQIITTLAGTGSFGKTGDGGYAAFATMNTPGSVLADNKGNIYFCDQGNARIRKIDAYGFITTIAGQGSSGISGDGGPASAAKVNYPSGLIMDKVGNIYFADSRNNRIRKIDTAGIISTVAGNGVAGYTGDDSSALIAKLNQPHGIALDDTGALYIADTKNNVIRKVTPNGIISTIAGGGDTVFIAGGVKSNRIKLWEPNDIVIGQDKMLYISDTKNNAIRKINLVDSLVYLAAGNGLGGYGGDEGLANTSRVFQPTDMNVDIYGNIIFADRQNNRVRMLQPDGKTKLIAGNGTSGNTSVKDGGKAVDAEVTLPNGVASDSSGNVYISDATNRIRFVYRSTPVKSEDITLFPNPCYRSTNIFLPSEFEDMATILIFDAAGREMNKILGPTNKYITLSIDLPGAYFIYAATKRASWTGRFISVQ